MAIATPLPVEQTTTSDARRRRWPLWAGGIGGLLALLAGGAAVAMPQLATVTLSDDDVALAQLKIGTLGGSVSDAHVLTAAGRRVAITRDGHLLNPDVQLGSGQTVRVSVDVERPAVVSWFLGKKKHEEITVATPTAEIASRWIAAADDGSVRVGFRGPVATVAYAIGDQESRQNLKVPSTSVAMDRAAVGGSVRVAASARPWERLDKASTVTVFPHASAPTAIVTPEPGTIRGSASPIRITFAGKVHDVLNGRRPTLTPKVDGHWSVPDAHTLVFTPTGYGTPFGVSLKMDFPQTVALSTPHTAKARPTKTLTWTSHAGSILRLKQLLADAGYLPLTWKPAGRPVARTRAAESAAAASAPAGRFVWRYPNTPSSLKRLWSASQLDVITRGALMKYQDEHHLTADAVAGPAVWKLLLDDAIAGRKETAAYTYVYVHRGLPQHLVLWRAGKNFFTTPGNTGVPAAPTALGTYPVYIHVPETTMSGVNPDGSHYTDPGIKWVSYFNGGDGLHEFPRASYGTPQSVGCVELPMAAAAKIYPYTPIGTLVTIET